MIVVFLVFIMVYLKDEFEKCFQQSICKVFTVDFGENMFSLSAIVLKYF